ncbi:hypothetical protein [Flavobacterium sp.]|jgi:hypothetical protein|uniref:hypothetical protein n=1 Tax=Flavobacterium sp. TaxID=239 RepID=UPI0037BF58E4
MMFLYIIFNFNNIIPVILTLVGNLIFYLFIKNKVDKSIEENKIAYSGVFREKIDIYRELLNKTYSIKKELYRIQYVGTIEDLNKLMYDINDYIKFYTINQPFLSDKMLTNFIIIRDEFQNIFDEFYKHFSNNKDLEEFFKASSKLKENNPFDKIEQQIISEMKTDLKIDKTKSKK